MTKAKEKDLEGFQVQKFLCIGNANVELDEDEDEDEVEKEN